MCGWSHSRCASVEDVEQARAHGRRHARRRMKHRRRRQYGAHPHGRWHAHHSGTRRKVRRRGEHMRNSHGRRHGRRWWRCAMTKDAHELGLAHARARTELARRRRRDGAEGIARARAHNESFVLVDGPRKDRRVALYSLIYGLRGKCVRMGMLLIQGGDMRRHEMGRWHRCRWRRWRRCIERWESTGISAGRGWNSGYRWLSRIARRLRGFVH